MSAWWDSLAVWLADYYLAATLLLAAACAALALVRQPARRLAVGWAAMGSLAVLAVLAALPGWPRLSIHPPAPERRAPVPVDVQTVRFTLDRSRPAETARARPRGTGTEEFTLLVTEAEFRRLVKTNAEKTPSPRPLTRVGKVPAATDQRKTAGAASGRLRPGQPEDAWEADWPAALVSVFLAGGVLVLGWVGLGAAQVRRLCRRGVVAPPAMKALLRRVVGGRGRCPRLLLHDGVSQPVALGILRPTIVLPARAAAGVAEPHLEAVLAHEWAHIRRGDLWLLALGRWLLTLLFAHPLYWWLRGRIREDQEALADAAAAQTEGAIDYAATLLHWVRLTRRRRGAAAAALALWGRPSELKRRITMLLHPQFPVETRCPGRWRLGAWGAMGLGVLALSVLSVRPLPTASAEEPAVKPAPKRTATPPAKSPAAKKVQKAARPTAGYEKTAVLDRVFDLDMDGTVDVVLTAQASAPVPTPSQPKAPQKIKAEGRVAGPDNKPVAGAEVAVVALPGGSLQNPKVLGRTKTDAKGRYRLQATNPSPASPVVTLVRAKGYGLGWTYSQQGPSADVRLLPEEAVRVRLIDLQGQPAAGVKVAVCRVGSQPANRGRYLLAQTIVLRSRAGKVMEGMHRKDKESYAPPAALALVDPPAGLPLWPEGVTTDSAGRLTLHGFDAATGIGLQVRDGRFALQAVDVKPRKKGQAGEVMLVLGPARILEGTVTEAGTRKPVPGARLHLPSVNSQYLNQVFFVSLAGSGDADWKGRKGGGNASQAPLAFFDGSLGNSPDRLPEINVRADKHGRFRIPLYQAGAYQLRVSGPAGGLYFDLSRTISWPKAAARQELNLSLLRGVWVKGQVTETPSGKPVANARVDFWSPGLRLPEGVTAPGSIQTDTDGGFRVLLPPGSWHAVVNAAAPVYLYQKIPAARLLGEQTARVSVPGGKPVTVNPRDKDKFFYPDGWVALAFKAGADEQTAHVKLEKVVIKGKLVGPNGKPVKDAVMMGRPPLPVTSSLPKTAAGQQLFVDFGGNFASFPGTEAPPVMPVPVRGGRFELTVNDLAAKYQVFFVDPKNNLGAAAAFEGGAARAKPPTVEMAACGSAKARLVDEKGRRRTKYRAGLALLLPPGPHPLHIFGHNLNWNLSPDGKSINTMYWLAGTGSANHAIANPALAHDRVWWNQVDPAHYAKGPVTDERGNLTLPTLIGGATYRLFHLDGKCTDFKVESGKVADLKTITVVDPPKPPPPVKADVLRKPVRIKLKKK
jgi:protocatechuate 3,4-dioxygenase beta subunit